MRINHVTIRELSKIMGITMKRIGQIREIGLDNPPRFETGFKPSLAKILDPSNSSTGTEHSELPWPARSGALLMRRLPVFRSWSASRRTARLEAICVQAEPFDPKSHTEHRCAAPVRSCPRPLAKALHDTTLRRAFFLRATVSCPDFQRFCDGKRRILSQDCCSRGQSGAILGNKMQNGRAT